MEYLEAIEDDARTNYQFDVTGGSAKAYYYTRLGLSPDLHDIIKEIYGYTNPFSTAGQYRLSRRIPKTHPKFSYLYAQRISSLIGKGSATAVREPPTYPTNPAMGNNPIADYFKYQQYEVGVDFSTRPYPIIADTDFTASFAGSWYKRDGTLDNFTYAPEWVRYTDYDYFPQDNTIQGQQGSMSLWGIPAPAPDHIPFQSPPWMWLPDMQLKINWYQVPYRYITSANSYIAPTENRNWRGRVNQNWFWNWAPGSLLYMSYSVKKYTPPTPDIGTYASWTGALDAKALLGNLLNYERLCDIELTFLYTNRYRSGSLGAVITNKNHVPAGHNVLPNLADNKFYYATRTPIGGTESVQNPPAWLSFPLEALFSDPDVAGGPSTSGDN